MFWAKLIVTIIQCGFFFFGGTAAAAGVVNAGVMAFKSSTVGYASTGTLVSDGLASGGLLGGGILAMLVPLVIHFAWQYFAPQFEQPAGLKNNVTEAVAALVAWGADRGNPKRAYAVLLELQDVQFDLTSAFAPASHAEKIKALQTQLSIEWHAALGPQAAAEGKKT